MAIRIWFPHRMKLEIHYIYTLKGDEEGIEPDVVSHVRSLLRHWPSLKYLRCIRSDSFS